ncbi:hypothetical protein SRHO_G00181680 [Serrasalmus rhombeus]
MRISLRPERLLGSTRRSPTWSRERAMGPPSPSAARTVGAKVQRTGREDEEEEEEEEEGEEERLREKRNK